MSGGIHGDREEKGVSGAGRMGSCSMGTEFWFCETERPGDDGVRVAPQCGCTALPLNCALKMVRVVHRVLCKFHHNKLSHEYV